MKTPFLILSFLVLALPAFAQLSTQQVKGYEATLAKNPNDQQALEQLGIYYHNRGGDGDKKAVKKSVACLERLLKLDGRNVLALAYYGSAVTMQGRDAWMPWNKMKYVNLGTGKLDKAVMIDSANVRVRLVRAVNSTNLPAFLNRRPFALRDFAYLVARMNASDEARVDRVQVYYFYGVALKAEERMAEAKKMWERAVAENAAHPLAKRAAEQLKQTEP